MITQKRLKEVLNYDPETGIFTWKIKISKKIIVGTEPRSLNRYGYKRIRIDKRDYMAHRLAFLYMTGEFPKDQVDHINRIRTDNRFCNLRNASNAQNQWNKSKLRNNSTGFKGIHFANRERRFVAKVNVENKTICIGYFKELKCAVEAYENFVRKAHGEFSCL